MRRKLTGRMAGRRPLYDQAETAPGTLTVPPRTLAGASLRKRSRVAFHEYAREWVERYQGRGRRGFRENTCREYRRVLEQYVLPYFPERT